MKSEKFHENLSSGSPVVPCGQWQGRTDGHDEANSRFSQFCKKHLKMRAINMPTCSHRSTQHALQVSTVRERGWRCALRRVLRGVPKNRGVSIFRSNSPIRITKLHDYEEDPFETSATSHPTTDRNTPEDSNLQQQCSLFQTGSSI